MTMEHRTLTRAIRATTTESEGSIGQIEGYGALFNSRSQVLADGFGSFVEEIAPGAFDDALGDDVRALVDHESGKVLGRSSAGTLRLEVDDVGLKYTVDLPDTQVARDLMVSMERGDIKESSFGFTIADGGDSWRSEDGAEIRTITKVERLYDVSPVAFPAYADTTVALRNLQAFRQEAKPSDQIAHFRALAESLGIELDAGDPDVKAILAELRTTNQKMDSLSQRFDLIQRTINGAIRA